MLSQQGQSTTLQRPGPTPGRGSVWIRQRCVSFGCRAGLASKIVWASQGSVGRLKFKVRVFDGGRIVQVVYFVCHVIFLRCCPSELNFLIVFREVVQNVLMIL